MDSSHVASSPPCETEMFDFSQMERLSALGKFPYFLVFPPHALDPDLEQVERFCVGAKDILWVTEGTV